MRSLLKLLLISAAIVLLVAYHAEIGEKISELWAGVSPSGTQHPLEQSVQRAGAAVGEAGPLRT